MSFVMKHEFSLGVTKIQGLVSHELTAYFSDL